MQTALQIAFQFLDGLIRTLPPGEERDDLMRRARQTELTRHLNEWMTSPGLASPT